MLGWGENPNNKKHARYLLFSLSLFTPLHKAKRRCMQLDVTKHYTSSWYTDRFPLIICVSILVRSNVIRRLYLIIDFHDRVSLIIKNPLFKRMLDLLLFRKPCFKRIGHFPECKLIFFRDNKLCFDFFLLCFSCLFS